MRVLVTRPRDDAEETAARLAALGHDAIIAPLLDIDFRGGPEIPLDGIQAILATSANGIRALARRTERRDVPVLAVGEQSADAARRLGFTTVDHAGGDVAALCNAAAARLSPQEGAIFYSAGAETRGRLAEQLTELGFSVVREVLYDAIAASSLPREAETALAQGKLDAVLLFSPRSARIFAELAGRAGLAERCSRLTAYCLSEAVAEALGRLPLKAVRIAVRPDQEMLLALLAR